METLLSISIALLAGLFMSRLAKVMKCPAVTGYLVAGILIGPFLLGRLGLNGLGFVSLENVKSYGVINNTALGFIAFSIGNEFRLEDLKHTGKKAVVIGIFEAFTATILVDIVMVLIALFFFKGLSLSAAITLGSIAAATAPAATLMVVRQYKAKGKVTSLLLPIVALDDALGLIIFAVSFGIAKALLSGQVDVISIVVNPLIEIILSLAFGAFMGIMLTYFERFFHSRSKRLSVSIGFVALTVAISLYSFHIGPVKIGFSSLLVCMMLGTLFCNLCDFSEELMARCDRWTAPLFILFFVLSGAELDFSVFKNVSIIFIGLIYIVVRAAGKYLGAFIGSCIMKCDSTIRKYLGVTLFPQAGVALGMSLSATQLGDDGIIIRNIILFGVLIYELFGPTMTRIALTKSGDIKPEGKTSSRGVMVH